MIDGDRQSPNKHRQRTNDDDIKTVKAVAESMILISLDFSHLAAKHSPCSRFRILLCPTPFPTTLVYFPYS
ncbi:hypothetical protein L873DRAFT_1814964 [Choiromyces venosus 120613-1]|uniref:Uncharacterized protein n=1 Tax=Choiromyces venosus 120613-1 TaxID=1336337 RepID=A0A3N4JJK4_9PEZI|nr:hypothetical protein L873DRAFT_1814964 [Choiromyces venosus 120613-1]